jgi:hypothetical protein
MMRGDSMSFLNKIDWSLVLFITGSIIQEFYNCHIRFPRIEYWEMEQESSKLTREEDEAAA